MWRDPEPTTGAARALKAVRSSPALQVFELNLLRLLRIAPSATTADAACEAERVLTLARADMVPDAPDPLPWLPQPGLPELQQAAQAVEEPLLRLKQQLLWFDVASGPHGAQLAAALRDRDEAGVAAYLAIPLPAADAGEGAAIPLAINQANLRLLLAAARIDGLWSAAPAAARTAAPLPEKDWQPLGGLRSLAQAHLAVGDAPSEDTQQIGALWRDGIAGWLALLADPRLRDFVIGRIAAIDDDFVQPDDAEALEESIRAHLADISAQEIRFLLIDNRYGLTQALVAALATSGLEPRVLTPAMRPVRQLLQTELAALEPLLEQAENDRAAPVAHYLRRLAIIRDRWLTLDEGGILGLADLIDQASERAFLRLRQWDKPTAETDALLEQAAGIASAGSLRERIATLRSQHQERREFVCHYCQENDPDFEKSVMLRGKKETGRTRKGNVTTIHSLIMYRSILRCGRCAAFHDYLRTLSMALASFLLVSLAILGLLWFTSPPAPIDYGSSDYNSSSSDLNASANSSDLTTSDANAAQNADTSENSNLAALIAAMQASNQAQPASGDATLSAPDLHGTTTLSQDELRYCLTTSIKVGAESARLDEIKGIPDDTDLFNRNVDSFNARLEDYQGRCVNRDYMKSDREEVEPGVEAMRAEIEKEGRDLVQ